jgi:quinol monooxygenase YgiN
MKSLFGVLVGALTLFAAAPMGIAANAPASPPEGTIYATTFVEVMPSAVDRTAAMLRTYRAAARQEPGAMRVDIYEEIGTPARFVTNEVWENWDAYQDHAEAPARTELYAKLKPIEFGPPDARTHTGHFLAGENAHPPADSIFVISHLDVTPPKVPDLLELMKPLTEMSAKEPGVIVYEILRQNPGTNHFRLLEVWANEDAWVKHNLSAHTQAFRNGVAPLLGTPYDQRRYTILN